MLRRLKQKTKVNLDPAQEEKTRVCGSKLSNGLLCRVVSHTYHYHKSIAVLSQLSVKAVKMLEDKQANDIQRMCEVDEDQEQMFKLMATLKPFGIRDRQARFDIEFPSRN